jgi:sulfite reductase alpha subunit-like flavoprotein
MFLQWSMKLWEVLGTLYPLPTGLVPIPEDELLPPRYLISLNFSRNTADMKELLPLDSFPCKVKQNQRMTAPGHWQDVRHIILESEQLGLNYYEPGDIAVVWPENPKDEVDIFLETLHWAAIADTPLTITTMLTDTPLLTRFNPPTLRSLATTYLDICSVPRRSFFEMLKYFSTDQQHIEKFTEFCTSEGQEELWDYTTRPRRTIVEVLADFWSSLKIPLEYVLDVFPPMKPRRFSIASSLQVFSF